MRTIEKVFNVYTIDELTETAKEKALETMSEWYADDFANHYSEEFLKSAEAFAAKFNMKVTDWSIGLYDRNYITVDTQGYFELTNEERNALVKELNESFESESDGVCSLTGVYTDCYFFDYFTANGKTSYNSIHKDIVEAVDFALRVFVSQEEENSRNEETLKELANRNEREFYENGTVYNG